MNYEEYLRRRISSPSNGLITRGDIYGSVTDGGVFGEVEYKIYDSRNTTTVSFGKESLLGYSNVSKATAYSNLVRYGWELLTHGVELVLVRIGEETWRCARDLVTNKGMVSKALGAITEHVSFEPNGGVEIPLYCSDCNGCLVWFNFPGKPAARNAYLANLNRYITSLLGKPIQVGAKNLEEIVCDSTTSELPVITSLDTLAKWGCRESAIERLKKLLEQSGLELLQDYHCNFENTEESPVATIMLRLGDQRWLLPLYGEGLVTALVVNDIERLVEDILFSARSSATADLRELEPCRFNLAED